MNDTSLIDTLRMLSTAHLADACLRVDAPLRCAPSGLAALSRDMRCAGRVLPVRHFGSVEVFFEAFERAAEGDVLVVGNGGRLDEACIGDLMMLEAKQAGLAGIVVWGMTRDTSELLEIGLPLFSLGTTPARPQRLDPRPPDCLERTDIGIWAVTRQDYVVGDADGVVFLHESKLPDIVAAAVRIRDNEREQGAKMQAGISLRGQIRFDEFLRARAVDPTCGFQEHIQRINEGTTSVRR